MIPDPGYTQQNAARAMSAADLFIQQTRAQAAQQLSQPAAAFTGGVGGAQPGIMSYAAGRAGAFGSGFGASMAQSAGQALGGMATVPAAAAAFATPGARQFGDIIEGARYGGGGAQMGLTGMVATGYAPLSMFPHAGMAFGMEQGTRREMAREELSRRWTQGTRAAAHAGLNNLTLGLSSYVMRRTGTEARMMTEMETERTLQNSLGVVRGGPYAAFSGRGVSRDFFTEGPGRAAMNVMQNRAGALQSQFGYGAEQMNTLTRIATGAIDASRVQNYAAGGRGGMSEMGREISDIRETAAKMAREMQMSEKEIGEFFGRLKGVMEITGEGVKKFQQENRRLSMHGPFSQKQVASMRMQFTQMGRQMYMGGADFGTEAMDQANRVAELRRSGVISAETLLREGGGLDPQAMARMVAARLQQQAGAVQGGNFNQSLVLASQNPTAYGAMMGGASYMQTQGAVGATMATNPFALLMARLDPDAVRRVTVQAPTIAYQKAQQMGDIFVSQNDEQNRAQKIRNFGQKMGFDVRTAAGLGKARIRYEEMEVQQENIEADLRFMFEDAAGKPAGSKREIREMSSNLMGIMADTGETSERLAGVMLDISDDVDMQRKWSSSGAVGRTRMAKDILARRDAKTASEAILAGRKSVGSALMTSPAAGIRKAIELSRSMAEQGIDGEIISRGLWAGIDEYAADAATMEDLGVDISGGEMVMGGPRSGLKNLRIGGSTATSYRTLTREKRVRVGIDQFEIQKQTMKTHVNKIRDLIEEKQIKTGQELQKAIGGMEGPWKTSSRKSIDPNTDLGAAMIQRWKRGMSGGGGGELTVESIRQAGVARQEWARAKRAGAGVFDIMERAGVRVDSDMTSGMEQLLTMDLAQAKAFEKLQADPRMGPLVKLAEQLGGSEVRTKDDFKVITKELGPSNMRKFFKEYAASEEGLKRLGGKSFQEFLGRDSMKAMNELYSGMSKGEKQAFMARTLTSAIEKSQRLVNETKRGDTATMPVHVSLDSKQIEAIRKK